VRLLLDTHALYWYVEGDAHLSATARTIVQDASNEVLMSPASYWEIAIKLSLGKWKLNGSYDEFIDIALQQYRFQLLPILLAHTSRLLDLPFYHKDPFDRLLVAQALVEGIDMVSNDSAIDAYGIKRIW
jgi:PIN domain nuclease of toxin-antitoxin system